MSRKQRKQNKSIQLVNKARENAKSSFTSTAAFWPGTPPQPSILFGREPRQWPYTPGTNLVSYPRASEPNSFETLRNLSLAYDVVQMCEQVWFDVIRGLEPTVVPEQGLLKDDEDPEKYQSEINEYQEILKQPDGVTPLLDFVCEAVKDRLELGVMVFYPRRTRGGGFFALEPVDAATLKPLVDVYGRRPNPPMPAYEQYLYGTPAGLYTSDDILYFPENKRTNSLYAISRVEMFLTRINQALRKQSRDMARFTDGNLPAGIVELPADVAMNWTPKDLADFREQWNAMYAGNDRARAGARIGLPGTKYTKIDEDPITSDIDRFYINIGCACFGVTMADLSFTETINRATAEAQRGITYIRTVHPTARVFEEIFTWIIKVLIGDTRFRFKWKGYAQEETLQELATAHIGLVQTGIESPSDAARALKIPVHMEVMPFVITKTGIVTINQIEKLADITMQQAQKQLEAPTPSPQTESSTAPDETGESTAQGEGEDDDAA